jgi:hypothetical protein
MCVVGLSPASLNAAILEFSFSGTLGTGFGVLHTGDAFSGSGIWDDTTIGAHTPNFADLTSLTLNLPAADGLSVPSLPDAAVIFAGAGYSGSVFNEFQLNIKSSTDSNTYVFFIARTAGCPPGVCNAAVTNANFTQTDRATSFSPSGPVTLPEPATSASVATGLAVLLAFFLIRRFRTRPTPRAASKAAASA